MTLRALYSLGTSLQAASIEFHYKENAIAAISDPNAVLNNRFIRIFFGRAERKATEPEVDKFAAIVGALEVAAQAEKNVRNGIGVIDISRPGL